MRVLAAGIGSRGDVQPLFALAQALRTAGHEVILMAPPDFSGWAASQGFAFVSVGRSVEESLREQADAMGANPVRVMRGVRDMIVKEVPQWFERTLEAARGVDVIVSAAQLAAQPVAEHLRIPCVGVSYSPTFLRSRHHAPISVPWQGLPGWLNLALWNANDAFFERILHGPMSDGRARLGLPRVNSIIHDTFETVPFLLAADPVVAAIPPDWAGKNITVTGPWFYDDPTPLDPEVDAFLRDGAPPVYIGFGSMVAKDAARLTRAVLEGTSGHRVLLSGGWAGLGAEASREGLMVVRDAIPHAQLFPRVAAVVHHGGAGTLANALRAGAPQVIVPHIMDQYYWGSRLEKLGIAPAPVPVKGIDGQRLERAIAATLALPPAARMAAQARVAPGGGRERAVTCVENIYRTGRPLSGYMGSL